MARPLRLGALISGGGRTLMNLADRIDDGELDAEIAIVIASRGDIGGVRLARERGFDVQIARRRDVETDDQLHDTITRWLLEADVQLVCLCGYLRWMRIDDPFRGRVMNIHPALLPAFGGEGMYGDHVHQAVLDAGHDESGCTVHFVDEKYDHGPIIVQRRCPVQPDDTVDSLAGRVFEQECIAYPEAIRLFAEGRARMIDGRTKTRAETRRGA
jgi:phosphoribosylglycinamide formyltransferase-1